MPACQPRGSGRAGGSTPWPMQASLTPSPGASTAAKTARRIVKCCTPARLRCWREARCGEVGWGIGVDALPHGGQRVGRMGVAGQRLRQTTGQARKRPSNSPDPSIPRNCQKQAGFYQALKAQRSTKNYTRILYCTIIAANTSAIGVLIRGCSFVLVISDFEILFDEFTSPIMPRLG